MSTNSTIAGTTRSGLTIVGQRGQPRIGQLDDADVGLDGAERIVLGGDAGLGQRVEQGGLADVGQADDAALEAHGGLSSEVWGSAGDFSAAQAALPARASPVSFEARWSRATGMPTRSLCSMPFEHDGIHAEGDRAVHARVGAVGRAACRRLRGRLRRVAGSTSGIEQRAQGLTSRSTHRALGGRRCAARRASLRRARPGRRARCWAGSARMSTGAGRAPPAARSARPARPSTPPAAESRRRTGSALRCRRSSCGSTGAAARGRSAPARSALAEEVAEPLRRQVAHVVGLRPRRPRRARGRGSRPRPAPGAAPACPARAAPARWLRKRRPHQRHARQLALA